MLIFLINECTQQCVHEIFDKLTDLLGLNDFRNCFPIILTDKDQNLRNQMQ
jgi:hypothetical protein